jgi:hypothetical protein
MDVVCLTRWEELVAWSRSWPPLARGVPFRSWEWLGAWWRHYGEPDDEPHGAASRRLFCLAVVDGQRLVGLAPWYVENHPADGRVVCFLGSGDVCSDYLSVLCLPEFEERVAANLACWLCEGGSGRGGREAWDVLLLGGVDAADRVSVALVDELALRQAAIDCRPGPNCWRVELPDTWDEYLATVSKSHRKQIRRFDRRLFASGRAVARLVGNETELARGLEILAHLHTRRRHALGDAGRFADPRFAAFHQEVAAQLLARGVLRLTWVELDGLPVAAEYQLAGSDVVYAYQSGIEPTALAYEPGRLAMMATLRPAIADGYRAFDFLRGDEPYKAHWRAQPRPGLEVRVFSRRGGAWLRQRARSAGRQMRDWLRGLAPTSDRQPPTSTRPLVMPLAPTAGHDAAASAFNIPTSSPRA